MPKTSKKKKLSPAMVKRTKLVRLQSYMNLETGALDESALPHIKMLYKKAAQYKRLCAHIRQCRKCPGLNAPWITEGLPGSGSLDARVMIVGQSLHDHGVKTGVQFILGSGLLIDIALALSGVSRTGIFVTNAVHCHPPNNRPSSEGEKKACLPFLEAELKIVSPDIVVSLGNDAKQALDTILGDAKVPKRLNLVHPAAFWRSNNPDTARNWILKLSNTLDKYK